MNVMPDHVLAQWCIKPVIKFKAPDGVLLRMKSEPDLLDLDIKFRKSCKIPRVFIRIKIDVTQHLWRDPTGAGFMAREILFVEQQEINPVLF